MTIVEFIEAQLSKRETSAKAAPGEHWQAFTEDDIAGACVCDEQWRLFEPVRYDHNKPLSNRPGATGPQYIQHARNELCAHIAANDPAFVLRQVAADRLLLDEYASLIKVRLRHEKAFAEWSAAVEEEERTGTWPLPGSPDVQLRALRREADYLDAMQPVLERLLKARAAVYDDHPDYRLERKP